MRRREDKQRIAKVAGMKTDKKKHAEVVADGDAGRLFIKRRGDGTLRRQWSGRFMVCGKRRKVTLCRWAGTPPAAPGEAGDAAFERSRERARKMLAEARAEWHDAGEMEKDRQRVYQIRYRRRVDRVKIADLGERWEAMPHKVDLTEGRRERVLAVLGRFASFMATHFPRTTEAGALEAKHFKAFLEDVEASGVSARTWNDYLSILRGVLAKVDAGSSGFMEYLAHLPKKTEMQVHRRPFDAAELDAILAAAAEVDTELRPVIVAAVCTALRRGDVCRLRWSDVDLAGGFVIVKTTKTGEVVEIPILPPFRDVLEDANKARRRGVPYVWPRIAMAYARNPNDLDKRLRRVLAAAGFMRPEAAANAAGGKYEAPADAEAAAVLLEDGMARAGWTAKRKAKARQVLALHFEGKNGKEIAEALEIGKGAVSDYLHAMEDVGRMALVSAPKAGTLAGPAVITLAEMKEGEPRKHRGSLCGWHAFRTTFCTLALAAGMSMDLLRTITGHRTAEIVLKYYNRPRREQIRAMMARAMPLAIGAGASADSTAEKMVTMDATERVTR